MDAPFFERIGTVEELQKCKQQLEALQTRVHDLERINSDLEYRLEDQAKQSMLVEKECISLERKWRAKCELLEKDTETWKREYESEKLKSEKLREHLSRTERELYSILQRKYELMRSGGSTTGRGGGPGRFGAGGPNGLLRGEASNGNVGQAGGGGDGGGGGGGGRGGLSRSASNSANASVEELLANRQAKAPQEIRQRRMMASLADFLGV